MRIAILQNRIGVDGRSVVVAGMVRVCNGRGVVPDIVTFAKPGADDRFRKEHWPGLQYRLVTVKGPVLKRGTAYQTPLLNMLVRNILSSYEVVLNSGRCPYFLPPGPRYVHYVHFPVEDSLIDEAHFKSFKGAMYTLPLKLLYAGRAARVKDGFFVANSYYTLSRLLARYATLTPEQTQVIYPPCDNRPMSAEGERDIDVISLGSFISDKRQLEQLEIAAMMPSRNFVLIGGIKSVKYYNRCRDYVTANRLDNVEFKPDASREDVSRLLGRARIFLHAKRGEHFGISTVEAIGKGCLPMVHDSGGGRETVPVDKLRFDTNEDAKQKIEMLLSDYSTRRSDLMAQLRDNTGPFGYEAFEKKMGSLVFDRKPEARIQNN